MPQMMEGPTSVSFPWFSLREQEIANSRSRIHRNCRCLKAISEVGHEAPSPGLLPDQYLFEGQATLFCDAGLISHYVQYEDPRNSRLEGKEDCPSSDEAMPSEFRTK
jgi:hypothetical protein